ncbi:PKD domain-containing protein [Winogradskyella litorisediminis]|uniref:PKD domain-containing protein n=1 Tax=Winogradskyella litorisediminis TaxID=1156618 RepID=A0ABW3N7N1_9FLAO
MKKFLNKLKFISLFALVITFVGCDEDDVVLPQLEAGFTQTINQDTGTVTFLNTSVNATDYQWDFGDGTSSSLVNPIKTYVSGTYTVTLTATNVAGAEDVFEDTIVISIPEVIAFPISFDNPLVDYNATTFNGATFQVVENPDASGANPTVSNVGEITNSGASFEGLFFELGQPLDLTTDNSVRILFWSTTPVDVLMKLEAGTAGDVEIPASHGGTGWEELYFTFGASASYNQVTLFVDGPGTTPGTFYIDDLTQINEADIPCTDTDLEFPIDFDCETIEYATKIVGNVSFTVVDNPELSGINSEPSKVGQITNVGDNFENAFFNLDVPIDFSTDSSVKLKLFSSSALPVLLKFEDGTEADVEDNQMHMGTGWEELTFNLNSTGSYNDMVLFVAFNQTDAGTFYVDDFEQVSGGTTTTCDAEMSESTAASDLNITFQTDTPTIIEDNTAFSYIDNPDVSGMNTSCRVGQVTRFNNSPFDNIQIDLANKLDFNANEGIKIKVWSPIANTPILLKLEEIGNSNNAVEIQQNTTAANTWEELTFDFTPTTTPQFDKIVIFFNFNVADGSTYFFDDLMVYGSGGGGGPMPFDDGLLDNGDFQAVDGMNNVTEWIQGVDDTNPAPTVVDGTDRYYSIDITTATPGSPFNINVSQKLEIVQDETYTLSFEAWTDATTMSRDIIAGIGLSGGTFANNSVPVTIDATPTRYTLTLQASGFGAPDARVLFDLADEVGQVNIDDVSLFVAGGGGGGGTCPAPPAGQFIADGDFEANADCWLYFDNGGTASLSTTVSNGGGSNSGQITSASGANPGIKQERLGVGTIQPNTAYVVTFDIKADAANPLADGAILNAFTFSEPADGSPDPAVQHVLVQGDAAVSTNWETRTYTFTTAGNVGGGLSFLVELVCGGAATCGGTINIDNVSIVAQ